METVPGTVTCVVPVRDGAAFLGAALDSAVGQTHPPLEVLVVDDGSTDAGPRLARERGAPVRVIERARGTGPAAARNAGLAEARGEFVCFLDADDLFHPAKTERQLARFAARPELEISLARYECFWEPGLEDEEARYRALGRDSGTHNFGSMLARRAVFDRYGRLDPELLHGDQTEWLARARDAGAEIEVLDEVLAHRRMHAASLSHVRPALDSYVDIVKARLDRRRAAGARGPAGPR